MSEQSNHFTRENLDACLKELAKEYRRLSGKTMPAEIILVGGAAILTGYGFREMTADIDAVIHASSYMKDAINRVGDKLGLPRGWLNADFTRTVSYTAKLDQFSVHYRTFSNVLSIRTIGAEYLVAMKLRSGRQYKNDMSDIVGILAEHDKCGNPLSFEQIKSAAVDLYDSWDVIPENSKAFIEDIIRDGNFSEIYEKTLENERGTKDILVRFEENYPGAANQDNVNEILRILKEKREKMQDK